MNTLSINFLENIYSQQKEKSLFGKWITFKDIEKLEKFENWYMVSKKWTIWNNVFYARLFKTIYWYDGKVNIWRIWLKAFLLPGWLGMIEDTKWSPVLRWKKEGFKWKY